jgi:hypothetical protein
MKSSSVSSQTSSETDPLLPSGGAPGPSSSSDLVTTHVVANVQEPRRERKTVQFQDQVVIRQEVDLEEGPGQEQEEEDEDSLQDLVPDLVALLCAGFLLGITVSLISTLGDLSFQPKLLLGVPLVCLTFLLANVSLRLMWTLPQRFIRRL